MRNLAQGKSAQPTDGAAGPLGKSDIVFTDDEVDIVTPLEGSEAKGSVSIMHVPTGLYGYYPSGDAPTQGIDDASAELYLSYSHFEADIF